MSIFVILAKFLITCKFQYASTFMSSTIEGVALHACIFENSNSRCLIALSIHFFVFSSIYFMLIIK